MTLTEFLLARIAEDEEWEFENSHFIDAPGWVPPWWTRMVREVAVKRELVGINDDVCHPSRGYVKGWEDAGRWVLMTLALPHSDHPDYDEAWRP